MTTRTHEGSGPIDVIEPGDTVIIFAAGTPGTSADTGRQLAERMQADARRRAAEGQAQDLGNPWTMATKDTVDQITSKHNDWWHRYATGERTKRAQVEVAIARADRLRRWGYFLWGFSAGVALTSIIGLVFA